MSSMKMKRRWNGDEMEMKWRLEEVNESNAWDRSWNSLKEVETEIVWKRLRPKEVSGLKEIETGQVESNWTGRFGCWRTRCLPWKHVGAFQFFTSTVFVIIRFVDFLSFVLWHRLLRNGRSQGGNGVQHGPFAARRSRSGLCQMVSTGQFRLMV